MEVDCSSFDDVVLGLLQSDEGCMMLRWHGLICSRNTRKARLSLIWEHINVLISCFMD